MTYEKANEMATQLPKVKPIRHIDISAYGSELMAVGDINNDGRKEFVFMQGPGMLAAKIFQPGGVPGDWPGTHYTRSEDQALDCLTALDQEGKILWQQGTPWKQPIPFRQHGGHMMLLIEDIHGQGQNSLVRIRGNRLQILDGSTGQVTQEAALDDDGYSALHTARFLRDGSRHIIVKPCSDGLEGHPYACPVIAFDHNLRQVWRRKDFVRAGHTPLAYDVDGDGIEEFLIGAQCINADGSVRWTLDLPKQHGHPDRRVIADVNADGRREQVLAFEAIGLVVSDLQGRVLWIHPADHCGQACVGKFYADRPGLQIFGNNEHWRLVSESISPVASYLLDGTGKVIWESGEDRSVELINWPTSLGSQALLASPHAVDPDDARPFIMDGAGNKIAGFDIAPRLLSIEEFKVPHDHVVWGDWGDYYSFKCLALDDAGERILIWSRRDLWIFATEL